MESMHVVRLDEGGRGQGQEEELNIREQSYV